MRRSNGVLHYCDYIEVDNRVKNRDCSSLRSLAQMARAPPEICATEAPPRPRDARATFFWHNAPRMPRFDYRSATADAPLGGGLGPWLDERPQLPYLIPFLAFVLLMLPSTFGHFAGIDWETLWKRYLPLVYTAKTLLAALLLWYFWPRYTPIRWTRLGLGAAVGIAGTLLWIGTEYACQWLRISRPPEPTEVYNPDQMLGSGWPLWAFLCVRVTGPSLVVPVMEELFFRDFLMRALIRGARFQDVSVGTYTPLSLIGMSLLFGFNHGITRMFVAGVVYGLLMGVLLIRTKSLGACIVAHGMTNWTLYLYVIYTGDWQFM